MKITVAYAKKWWIRKRYIQMQNQGQFVNICITPQSWFIFLQNIPSYNFVIAILWTAPANG